MVGPGLNNDLLYKAAAVMAAALAVIGTVLRR